MQQARGFLEEVGVVLLAILRPAWGSVRENKGLAALSVVLAFGLWIFVTDAENPDKQDQLPFSIPVRPVNVPADVWVPEEVGQVTPEVRVEENVFDSLTKEDFEATADLTGLAPNLVELTVDVTPLSERGNLRIVEVIPPKIEFRLAPLARKAVSANIEMSGTPATGFSLVSTKAEVDSAEVDSANVAGPQDSVDKVTSVVALIDVEGRTESFESAVRLEARDQLGHLVQQITIDPAFIDVRVEIAQQSFSRALAVSPVVVGDPREGYNRVGVTVDPPIVTVFGSKAYIDGAVAISTQPVDTQDATEDVIRTVSLDLPPDVTVRGGGSVTVTVKISETPSQQVFAVPVTANGLGDDLSIAGGLPPVQVFLAGPLPDLLKLNPNDISATIDLADKEAGTHKVKVEVTAPEGLEVRSISPEEIEINLEQR